MARKVPLSYSNPKYCQPFWPFCKNNKDETLEKKKEASSVRSRDGSYDIQILENKERREKKYEYKSLKSIIILTESDSGTQSGATGFVSGTFSSVLVKSSVLYSNW